MYRRYHKDEEGWLGGLLQAQAFIAGPLLQHVAHWERYGQLGVQESLDCRELCERLHRLLDHRGAFTLVFDAALPQPKLLLIELGLPGHPVALCYGPWPGTSAWESQVQPALAPGLPLSRTFWNRMPRLKDLGDAGASADPGRPERRQAWVEEAAAPLHFVPHKRVFEAAP